MDEIEPGQDYEVIVDFRPTNTLDLEKFYSDLEEIGTSIQVGEGDGISIYVVSEFSNIRIDVNLKLFSFYIVDDVNFVGLHVIILFVFAVQ